MRIEEKTVFVCNGKQFDSEEKALAYEFDFVGQWVEAHLLKGITFHPRDRITLVENIIANRDYLISLLQN